MTYQKLSKASCAIQFIILISLMLNGYLFDYPLRRNGLLLSSYQASYQPIPRIYHEGVNPCFILPACNIYSLSAKLVGRAGLV